MLTFNTLVGNNESSIILFVEDESTKPKWNHTSDWIVGANASALSNKLKNLHKKDKAAFVSLVKEKYAEYKK